MAVFKRILCPIDFDQNSLAALAVARKIAEDQGAKIHLLYVEPTPPAGPEVILPMERLVEESRNKLERIASQKLGRSVSYEVHVRIGRPEYQVLHEIAKLRADLIVMATHGRKGLKHLLLGSVAEKVVREAQCPVLTVHPKSAAARASAKPKNRGRK